MSASLCATQYAAHQAAAALDFLFLATAQIFDIFTSRLSLRVLTRRFLTLFLLDLLSAFVTMIDFLSQLTYKR